MSVFTDDDSKRVSPFTDADLKRLKKEMPNARYGFDSLSCFGWEDFKALLHRLECAEKCLPFLGTYDHDSQEAMNLREIWRKSKGE